MACACVKLPVTPLRSLITAQTFLPRSDFNRRAGLDRFVFMPLPRMLQRRAFSRAHELLESPQRANASEGRSDYHQRLLALVSQLACALTARRDGLPAAY